ncbi:MAG TPA: LPS assembly protein LptD [Myxococcaceae bacterium]|nr:LPS assembly protein LptD [Myxococcaceae bacterium]
MSSALALLLVLGQVGLPLATPAANEPIQVRADRSRSDSDGNIIVLEGHAELRTSTNMVQGETITVNQEKGTVTATGHAFCASGQLGAVADTLTLELDTSTLVLGGGTFFEKKKVPPERLLYAKSPAELESLGQTSLAGTAYRIQRAPGGHLLIDGLTFTPCDCDPLHPHWSIQSSSADVLPGEGAWLWWPVIRVYGAPVFAFPVMYLPLADRKTGILPSVIPSWSAQNGLTVPLPVYVVLGRSADIEFDLGYVFGGSNPNVGVKGPTLDTTFRFVPSVNTHGTVELYAVYDLKPPRNPENGLVWAGEENQHTGTRWGLTSQITSILGSGWTVRLDLNLVSDSALVRDVSTDVVVQANQYLTSTLQLAHRGEESWVGLLLSFRQDTQFGYSLFGTDRVPSTSTDPALPPGMALRGPATLQQLPEVSVVFPERKLWGPLWGSLDLTFTRLSPVDKLFGDEGQDGLFLPVAPANPPPVGVVDPTQGNDVYEPATERQARDRLDILPRLVMTLPVGEVLRLRPSAWLRQDLYVGEITGAFAQRGYAVVDLLVTSELSRTFGEGPAAVRHAIQPSFELRDIVGTWGNVPGPQPGRLYDAIDWAVDTEHRFQGVVRLTQVLSRRAGVQAVELFKLDLAQEFDFSTPNGLGDSVATARTTLGLFSASAAFRWDNQRHAPALFGVGAGVAEPKYFIRARYDFVYLSNAYQLQNGIPQTEDDQQWVGGSSAQRRGIDALVGSPLPSGALNGSLLQFITLNAQVNLAFGLSIAYGGTLYPAAPPPPPGTPPRPFFGQQQLSLGFAPACNCWRLDVGLRSPPGGLQGFPQIIVDLTVAGFGTFGN